MANAAVRCKTSYFAKAMGKRAKTDRIDAQVLARFAQAVQPEVWLLACEAAQELQALVNRRQQLVEMLSAKRNRQSIARLGSSQEQLKRHIEWLQKETQALDQEIQA